MANNEVPFFNSSEWEQKHLEEILKNPPKPVSFTYTVDQLRNIYSSFTPVVDNTPAPRYIEDYYEFNKEPARGDVNKFINAIYEFYSLENKNDLSKVENIYHRIIDDSYDIQIPDEFRKAEQEISEHLNYLIDIQIINRYQQEQEKRKMEQMKQEQQLKEQQISPTERINNFFNTINGAEQKNNNQQQEETYVTLEQLEPLLSESGYMCYGHGTGRKGNSDEVVDSIFNEGLRTKNNSLYYTTIGLSTPTPELKEQFKEIGMPEPTIEDLKKQFNNWQHQDSKKIIIARIPTEYINKAGDRSDLDGEMFGAFYTQKQQPNGQATNYLDSKFIIGCFDVDKQAVRLNKKFERTLTPETIEQLKENYKKTVEKTNARKERQNLGITQEEINLSQQNQTQPVSYNTETYDSFDDNIEWNNTSSEQVEIDQLKEQIEKYNSQINTLLANMQPYMQIPKVNREISKVIEKNNEINSSQIIDSLNDYKTVVEIKQSLLTYLEQANKFIKDNVGKQQETVAQQQTQTQNSVQSSSNDFQGRIYNNDGTYTTEYMTQVATTQSGFNQEYYDRLMKENEFKRKQNEDPTSLLNDSNIWGWINDEEQMTSGGRHM